jgi:tRNA A37 methylthiotransferase MiaB
VIYGFPTETFQEFKDYFKLLKYYDCTDFLCYADKKGTKVSNLQKNSYNDILKKSLIILKVKEKV